jgi:4-hydroxy-4-methyl-2-oxoglutarate aldolase
MLSPFVAPAEPDATAEESVEVRVDAKTEVTLAMARRELSVPLLCDVLDALGYRNQSPRMSLSHLTAPSDDSSRMLVGYAKTTLWADMAHVDPDPYVLELAAVDSCRPDDVILCAAGGSMRSGIWGELLSTAARNRGVAGVIVDGAVRDVAKMRSMGFPVYGLGTSPYDSRDRQRVIDVDVAIEFQGVAIESGDLVAVDEDGMVVVPKLIIGQILAAAWEKAHDENQVRDAIRDGMTATAAFQKFGVL